MAHEAIDIPGISHANIKSYITGFVLSIVLTVIPFAMVMFNLGSRTFILVGIALAAIVQIVVHLHYFLHLDRSSEQSWNLQAILFTLLIIVILIAGSLWIMFDLHARMM
ncbi:cytochrome o ubiquinol oxidase subunit IV [Acidihalobacter prosperus]